MFEELFSKNPGHRSKHSYIIAVDQHAAHERILLERFEKECLDYFEVSQNRAIQEPQFLKIFSNKISLKLSRQLVPDIFNFLNQEPDKLCCLLKYGFSAILDSNSMGQFIFVTMIPRKNHYKLYSSYIVKQRGHKCQYHAPHQGPSVLCEKKQKQFVIYYIERFRENSFYFETESRKCQNSRYRVGTYF
ncbi:unnamed protein product [Schistosoma rodhaini]|uniref:MutL C-terminal dimerisation domain-containing protein n=1 Tax=Schistosoma rodhaini TaxID=6188 RepID=A0AA85FMD3_9TREM|nr:unnamed protein product [Schistosoma rodhaini]